MNSVNECCATLNNMPTSFNRGVGKIWQGGARIFFFRFENMHVMANPCALLGEFGGMPPPENFFFIWCKLVRFGVYLDQILILKIDIFMKEINILDTHLLWRNSREKIFGKHLQLMRFDVYFEIILNRK